MEGFRIIVPLLFVLLMWKSTNAGSISREKRQADNKVVEESSYVCECKGCHCIPYYQCKEDKIITDGTGLIDIRVGPLNNKTSRSRRQTYTSCHSYIDVCCALSSEDKPDKKEKYEASCGRRNEQGVGIRITGFKYSGESQYGEFPWMAAILREETTDTKTNLIYLSGGSLIEPDVILTTAHHVYGAVHNNQKLVVRMGEWDSSISTELFPHVDIYVKDVIIHEDFNRGNLHNDFALLILEKDFPLSSHIDTICLPTGYDNFVNETCVATGWGKNKFGKQGTFQNVLKKVELPIVDDAKCQNQLRTTRLGNKFILDDSFMCAGGEIGKDTCQGDGGSPLACPSKNDPFKYEVVGLVAFGIGCGEDGIPGVYADINNPKSLDWITSELFSYRLTAAYN